MPQAKQQFRHVVITGASSGIGAALAQHYAAPGIRLSLTGRDEARLENTAQQARSKGAEVQTKIVDVTDRQGLEAWLLQADDMLPVELLIANAGISAGTGGNGIAESAEQVRRLLDVNVTGVLNTIDPVLPRMMGRGHGHIALMSSLAGFRGWPGAPAYCASKAAVKKYGEGLRGAIAATGVKVHVICPGFVKSRMTDVNAFPMPFMMPAEKAAEIIARGIARNKGRISFPWQLHFLMWLIAAMPDVVAQKILEIMPAKSSEKTL